MGANVSSNEGNSLYLKISGDGRLFHSSKDEKQGYEKTETSNPQTGQKVISYRMYYKNVTGKITGVFISKATMNNHEVQFVNIKIEDPGDSVIIQLPLKTQRGGINAYVECFVRMFNNIDLDRWIQINPSTQKKKDSSGKESKYVQQNFFIKYEDGDKETVKWFIQKEDLPEIEKQEGMGEVTYDRRKRDNFLYKELTKIIEIMKDESSSTKQQHIVNSQNSEPAKAQSTNTYTKQQVDNVFDDIPDGGSDDDIPF